MNFQLLCRALVAAIAVASSVCFADVSEATFIPQGSETYSPISESQVSIFVYKPNFPFRVIGSIEARGMASGSILDDLDVVGKLLGSNDGPTEKDDIRLAIQAMKREAANAGANGVIIVKQGQVRVSQSATERRIIGAAIRY